MRELRQAGFEPDGERVDTDAAFRTALDAKLGMILSASAMPGFSGLRGLDIRFKAVLGGGLTEIEDIEPLIRVLVTDGWWISGQTIFASGGYTTR